MHDCINCGALFSGREVALTAENKRLQERIDDLVAEVALLRKFVGETVECGQPGVRITWTRYDSIRSSEHRLSTVNHNLRTENARLRGALDQVDELLEHLQSVEELLKKSWNINKTRQWIATALAPHECAGDYCEACDKGGGE